MTPLKPSPTLLKYHGEEEEPIETKTKRKKAKAKDKQKGAQNGVPLSPKNYRNARMIENIWKENRYHHNMVPYL